MANLIERTDIDGLKVQIVEIKNKFENNPGVQVEVFGVNGRKLMEGDAALMLSGGRVADLSVLGDVLVDLNDGQKEWEIVAESRGRFMFTKIAGKGVVGTTVYYEQDSLKFPNDDGDCSRERLIIETPFDKRGLRTVDVEYSLPNC